MVNMLVDLNNSSDGVDIENAYKKAFAIVQDLDKQYKKTKNIINRYKDLAKELDKLELKKLL